MTMETEFEQWIKESTGEDTTKDERGYIKTHVEIAWLGWKAAWERNYRWQPIETALKYTDLLVFSEFGIHEAKNDGYDWKPAVQTCSDEYGPITCKPTHWMPLPPPPTPEKVKS